MQLFTGKQYLMIDIAGNFGLDHKDWDIRLQWFEDNKHQLLDLITQAKVPALYFAGIQAWQAAEDGRSSGYPISLDATCSGMQILTVLTGDSLAAKLCNVVDAGQRNDAYTLLYQNMVDQLGEEAKITRDDTKQAILTALYASEAIPKQVFGTGELLKTFYSTMETEVPAVWELNETYKVIWDSSRSTYSWVLPDNFHVNVKVMNQEVSTVHFLNANYDVVKKVHAPVEQGRSLGANTTHSVDGMIVREMVRRCNYNPAVVMRCINAMDNCSNVDIPTDCKDTDMVEILWDLYEQSGYLSARILDHLRSHNAALVDHATIWELIDSLPKKPFKVLTVHDCFRCLPNYGNDLRLQYNTQLALIAKSNLLSFILSQLLEREVEIGKLDPTLHTRILDSNYSLS